jgi:hypothetical protein
VYCPLVEPRMVGDAQVPLLRIVPVAGRDGEMMTRVPFWCFMASNALTILFGDA